MSGRGGDGERPAATGGAGEPEPPGGTIATAVRDPPSLPDTEPAAPTPAAATGDLPTVSVAHYDIEGEHARGGLGRILRARDRRLERPVAIKQLLHGGEGEVRFVREARLTARLQHPGIVPVHEVGRWPSGEPFYAMTLVRGRALKEAMEEAQTPSERLALLPKILAVADAVGYAHSQRIIHRDLKPSNVLVGAFGETVVVDWGLAKDLAAGQVDGDGVAASPSNSPDATMEGSVLGTPSYMAPEQARGEPVDERADVYGLGAILYHVLAGEPPYGRARGDEQLRRLLAGPPEPLARRAPDLPAELSTVVAKAMARAPADRFANASELAEDLRRFLTGQLVSSHAYTWPALLRRWVRRHRAVVSVVSAALVVLVAFAVVSARRILREQREAERQRARAEERSVAARGAQAEAEDRAHALLLAQARVWLPRDPTTAVAWLKSYAAGGEEPVAVRNLASQAWSRGVARAVLPAPEWPDHVLYSPDGRWVVASGGLQTVTRVWSADGTTVRPLCGAVGVSGRLGFVDDGRLAAAGTDGVLRLWQLDGGASVEMPPGGATAVAAVDGTLVVGTRDGAVWRRDGDGALEALVGGHHGAVRALAVARSGTYLISLADDGDVRVWSPLGHGRVIAAGVPATAPLAVSADGRQVAIGREREVVLADLVYGGAVRTLRGHAAQIADVAFAADPARLLSADMDGTVRRWDRDGNGLGTLEVGEDAIYDLASSADGTHAAAGGLRASWVWNLATGEATELDGHDDRVLSVAFSPGGDELATASFDGTVRIWRVPADSALVRRHRGAAARVALAPDGRTLASSSERGEVLIGDLGDPAPRALEGHAGEVWGLAFSPDGSALATATDGGDVRLWELPSFSLVRSWSGAGALRRLQFDAGGKEIVVSGVEAGLRVLPVDGAPARELGHHDAMVNFTVLSPDRQRLASSGDDGKVRVWDLATGASRTLAALDGPVHVLAWTPDGAQVVGATGAGPIGIWSATAAASVRWLPTDSEAFDLAVSPDGRTLATAHGDGTVRRWELATGQGTLLGRHDGYATRVAFSSDGGTLASGGYDGQILLWNVVTGESRALRGHQGQILGLLFAPDGTLVSAGGPDETVRIWKRPSVAPDLAGQTSAILVGERARTRPTEETRCP